MGVNIRIPSETFQAIISYLNEHLQSDNSFDKLIYKYMIKAGSITGRELCMILYEQNILNYDESQYNALASGATTAYDFMRGKIQTLEITPGQLGLEPCTGSFVSQLLPQVNGSGMCILSGI